MFRTSILASLGLALALSAGSCGAADASVPRSADVSSLDGLLRAYYEVVSGPAKTRRDVARDKSLHHPDARVYYPKRDATGQSGVTSMSVEQYHRQSADFFDEGFYEQETAREVRQFGASVHVWSSYESRKEPQGPVTGRGINSLLILFDGKHYTILAETWDRERKDNPMPAQAR